MDIATDQSILRICIIIYYVRDIVYVSSASVLADQFFQL